MHPYSDEQLILAARLYYIDQLSQSDVAKMMSVSQAKVSRMLTLARECGFVRITVADANPRDLELEKRLRQALGIETIVIRPAFGQKSNDLRQIIGYFAAEAIHDWLKSCHVIALAGGRTMRNLVDRFKHLPAPTRLEVVQAMGTVDASPGPFDAVELGLILAGCWHSSFVRLNTPAILQDADTCTKLLQLEQVQHVMGRLAEADAALIGVGTLENSIFAERGVLSPQDLQALRGAGAVGEIVGRYFDSSGRECQTSLRDRVVSLPLSDLRKIQLRIAVTTGTDRAKAICAAIRGGLLNALAIDASGAMAVLAESGKY